MPQSDEEAGYFLQRAASQGDVEAMTAMGSLYAVGRSGGGAPGEPYLEAAVASWRAACRKGCQLAGLKYATLLLGGGVPGKAH